MLFYRGAVHIHFRRNPLLDMFFQLLGALLGAPERRLGGKCAYYRGETLIIEGNVCFASVIHTFGEGFFLRPCY